MLLYYYNTYY
ncbi:uncharacterized protein FRV6_11400 [Fusarium oxysporum]|uniref:Uncharacterized protein n=1 Tax=Fusarium oxysporum TaxID=5507 RepID=A0A2H3TEZ5_FUSOX|nr:uncharacterized protein FRV6_11400 [Fusarium oxysporum]